MAADLDEAAKQAHVRLQLIRRFGRRPRQLATHVVLAAHTGPEHPWLERLELATLEYINWFNTARLHGELDHTTAREFEEVHYRRHTPALAGARNHT